MDEAVNDTKFCLQKNSDGQLKLKTSHQYYYQVNCTINNYLHHIICCHTCIGPGPIEMHRSVVLCTESKLHIERIYPDASFMEEKLIIVRHFFDVAVLPQLLGRWFSRPLPDYNSISQSASSVSTTEACTSSMINPSIASSPIMNTSPSKYCCCQQGEYGDMVGCDGSNCPFQWFHLSCLKLKTLPKSSKWFCPDRRKLNQKKNV